jgi:hypothetical protein
MHRATAAAAAAAAAVAVRLFCCSNSGFNAAGSGIAGTGVGDYGRSTSGGTTTTAPGCILDDSGNMAITTCMTAAGKKRILRA